MREKERRLEGRDLLLVGFTLFSMFFGAGNLIFPPNIAAQAGTQTWPAMLGLALSAVGLPVLGVVAVARSGGLDALGSRVHPAFARVFTIVAYLAIGPCLAIPRTATTSFEMAVPPFVGADAPIGVYQLVYSLVFFAAALFIALRPEKLTDRLGKIMCPILIALIVITFVGCVINPLEGYGAAGAGYETPVQAVSTGFLAGYNTMDTIAALVFGIIISLNIRARGVEEDRAVVRGAVRAGIIAGVLLFVIYSMLAHIGALSGGAFPNPENGAQALTNIVAALFGRLGNVLLAAAIAVWMALIDWRIALACLVTVPIGLVVFASGLGAYNRMYAAYMAEGNHVNSVMVEYVEGIQVIKAFNQGSNSYQKYANAVRSFKDFTLGWFKATWVSMNLAFSILPTTLLGVLPVGLALYLAGDVTPAELGLEFVLALAVVAPLMKLSSFLNEAKAMEYAVADASEFLDLPELPEPAQRAAVRDEGVELANVSFSYESGEEVLHDVSLRVPRGSFCALVGPSGSGKSTLARLIARHWDVGAGAVRVGGVDVRDMPLDQLSQLVSFVAQDNYLFDCSLRENIRMGKPDATDDEVLAAARAACCDDFIGRLPHGYDTPAGEAGHALSGGERQRISIARAILKDAPIVVLDEATAFTDPENEERIQQSIARLTRGKTLLVIAHRLSTVAAADDIAVVDHGRIVAHGTHDRLLAACPLYASMWQAHVCAKAWSAVSRKDALDA